MSVETVSATSDHETRFKRLKRRLFAQTGPTIALIYLIFIFLVALFSPWLQLHPPTKINLGLSSSWPSWQHPLGTDDLGRDMFSRLVAATRLSISASFIAVGVAVSLGLLIGTASVYMSRWANSILMRFNDIMLVFPTLIFAVVVIGVLGPGLTSAMLAIGLAYAPYYARVVRSAIIAILKETYVEAASQMGASSFWILRKHLVPNVLSPLIVQTTLMLGLSMLAESGLSFIGLGVQPPAATWGSMLQRSFEFMDKSILNMIMPGALIMATVLAYNFLGDGLRDALGREDRR